MFHGRLNCLFPPWSSAALFVLFRLEIICAALPATQLLTNGWQLARVPDVPQTGAQISAVSFDSSGWINAVVPGTALTSYQNSGLIGDPYFGTNMVVLENSGCYDTYYWYRDAFYVPAGYSEQKIWLNFDGINWLADIYVNGSYVASLNGPFIRGKYDVTSLLTLGSTNCVAVMLHWSNATVYDSPTFIGADSWDFIPAVAGREVGLYQNVYLTTSGPVQIVDPFVVTTLPLPGTSPANLSLQVELTNMDDGVVSGVLSGLISPDGIAFQTNVTIGASSATNLTFNPSSFPLLSVTNPALWWPNGYGPQNLHNLQLTFTTGGNTSDVQNVSFGIRQYSYNTNGHDMQLSCNGREILCKGGNWGFADAMLKYTPEELDTAVRLHQQMNFTMIRCWHGNSDLKVFYDACDKYGIMVWDEFWLNGSNFGLAPSNPNMFIRNSIDKYKRLRNRACVAVWCGENEAVPPANLQLQQNYTNYDNTRIYIPASNEAPIHGGGPYALEGPLWYFQNAYGFTTEIGLPSVPPVESMEAMMPAASLWPLGDANWLLHNWAADIGNKGLPQYTNAVSSDYGAATGIADFCQKAQLLNLENYKAIFEAWNAKLFNPGNTNATSGVLLWMSQPAWPSLIWQTYDWYFELGGAYFGCKKGCEPIHIQWDCDDNSVRIIDTTTQALSSLSASIQVYNLNGTLAFGTNLAGINVAADGVTNCFTLFNGLTGLSSVHFIKLKLTDLNSNLLSDNFYWRGTTYENYTALSTLPGVTPAWSASYGTTNGSTTITAVFSNPTTNILFAARLKLLNASGARVLPTIYSDNYFSLVPGDVKVVTAEFTNNANSSGPLQLVLMGWNIPTQTILNLTISPAIPAIGAPVVSPENTVNQGTTVTMACTNYSGPAPYSFEWQASVNGNVYSNISGANTNVLVLRGVTVSNSGYYQLIFNANGQTLTSSVAPLTVSGSGHGARLSIKFAADKDYNYDTLINGIQTGVLNSKYWFNCYGQNGPSTGTTNVNIYSTNDLPMISRTVLVYAWASEYNFNNEQAVLPNNLALMDGYIIANDGWYLSVTNLDSPFTNGYSVYFYYTGNTVGWGGQNYVRYYAGLTTNSGVIGQEQWNLYTTDTNNDGHFTRGLTRSATSASGETYGANYVVFTNLSGGAFDLLITNGYYAGVDAMEIVANPLMTTSVLSDSFTTLPYGVTETFTNVVTPAPSDGELLTFMNGATVLGYGALAGGRVTYSTGTLGYGTNFIKTVYYGDANYMASTSSVLAVNVTSFVPPRLACMPVGNFAFELTWSSVPSVSYQTQVSTNLATGIWNNLGSAYVASGTNISAIVFKPAVDQEFFRISSTP